MNPSEIKPPAKVEKQSVVPLANDCTDDMEFDLELKDDVFVKDPEIQLFEGVLNEPSKAHHESQLTRYLAPMVP